MQIHKFFKKRQHNQKCSIHTKILINTFFFFKNLNCFFFFKNLRLFISFEKVIIFSLTLADSFKWCMAGSWIFFPEADFVDCIKSAKADATSLTALISMTCASRFGDPRLDAPDFTTSLSWTKRFLEIKRNWGWVKKVDWHPKISYW